MKKDEASGMGFLVSQISTSESRRGRADEVVGLRFNLGSSSYSVFTVFGWLASILTIVDTTTHYEIKVYQCTKQTSSEQFIRKLYSSD